MISTVDAMTLSTYADGQLACIAHNPSALGAADALELVIVEGKSGDKAESLGFLLGGSGPEYTLAYDKSENLLYFHDGSVVRRVDGQGGFTPVNYLSLRTYGNVAQLAGGYYAVQSYEGIYVRSVDENALAGITPVVIQGALYDDELVKAFSLAYPEIPVVIQEAFVPDTELATQLQTGAADVDLYLRSSYSGKIIENAYVEDLSGSTILADAVARMYPQVQDIVQQDGKLYGFPVALWTSQWVVREDLLDEYDLEIPATYLDYIDMYMDWYESDNAYLTDVMFTRDFGVRVDLLYSVLEQYEMAYAVPGEPLDFDHPVLRAAIEKILDLAPDKYEEMEDGIRYYSSSGNDNVIFDTWGGLMLDNPARYSTHEGPYIVMAPPPLSEETETFLPGRLEFLVLNPHSPHQENALTFLEFAVEHTRPDMRYLFYPDLNDPVPASDYAKEKAEVDAAIEELNTRLEEAEASERGEIEDELRNAESYLHYLSSQEWLISPESLQNYRALAPRLHIITESRLSMTGTDSAQENPAMQILQQLLSGQLTVDKALAELNHKTRMSFLEGQ